MDKNTFLGLVGTKFDPTIVQSLPIPSSKEVPYSADAVSHMWAKDSNNNLFPCKSVTEKMEPGIYSVALGLSGIYFTKQVLQDKTLLDLSNDVTDEILSSIESFQLNKSSFDSKGFPYRKGILIYGARASGKSTVLAKIAKSLITDKHTVLMAEHPILVKYAVQKIQAVEKDKLVFVLIDNVEIMGYNYGFDNVQDLLDNSKNTVFIATTGNPSILPSSLLSKASRLDSIYIINPLSTKDREVYFSEIVPELSKDTVATWVEKTDEFTIPELEDFAEAIFAHCVSSDEAYSRIKPKKLEEETSTNVQPVNVIMPNSTKKRIKTFIKDGDGNIEAIVDEEVDEIIIKKE